MARCALLPLPLSLCLSLCLTYSLRFDLSPNQYMASRVPTLNDASAPLWCSYSSLVPVYRARSPANRLRSRVCTSCVIGRIHVRKIMACNVDVGS